MLPFAPIALTSSNSFAYRRLVSAYGAGPPNCDELLIKNGLMSLSQAFGSLAKRGSTGLHWPARVPARNRNAPKRPSLRLSAIIASAAALPVAIPPSFAGPGEIAAIDWWYCGVSAAVKAARRSFATSGA